MLYDGYPIMLREGTIPIFRYDSLEKKCVTFWVDSTSAFFYFTEGRRAAANTAAICGTLC
jgi:hypothetical protein